MHVYKTFILLLLFTLLQVGEVAYAQHSGQLADLQVFGYRGVNLITEFSPSRYSYEVAVLYATTAVRVTATAAGDDAAQIRDGEGNIVRGTNGNYTITLPAPSDTTELNTTVTAVILNDGGETTRAYTITVKRPTIPAKLWDDFTIDFTRYADRDIHRWSLKALLERIGIGLPPHLLPSDLSSFIRPEIVTSLISIVVTPIAPELEITVNGEPAESGEPISIPTVPKIVSTDPRKDEIEIKAGLSTLTDPEPRVFTFSVQTYNLRLGSLRVEDAADGTTQTLVPAFAEDNVQRKESTAVIESARYSVDVPFGVSAVNVIGEPAFPARVTYNPPINHLNPIALVAGETKTVSYKYSFPRKVHFNLHLTITRAPSYIADLASLSLTAAIADVPLSPSFSSTRHTMYTAEVVGITEITMRAEAEDSNATIAINGTDSADAVADVTIPLTLGMTTTITAKVLAQDRTTSKTYIVAVNHILNDEAQLKDLHLSSGSLEQPFSPTDLTYTANTDSSSLYVIPTASVGAIITVNGERVSGESSQAISLGDEGDSTVITVVVISQDGMNTATYTITVTRTAAVYIRSKVFLEGPLE